MRGVQWIPLLLTLLGNSGSSVVLSLHTTGLELRKAGHGSNCSHGGWGYLNQAKRPNQDEASAGADSRGV